MRITQPNRRVITFYSYKGGVGRSMTLANVAFRLANTHGLRVIAVDWDLEAPGLHRFLGLSQDAVASRRGVFDYFIAWREAIQRNDATPPDISGWLIPVNEKPHAPRYGALSLLVAGQHDAAYDKRLSEFNWRTFYETDAGAAAVETLREQLIAAADVVLVDSRTGHTDAGGICTIQLPDAVVLMSAPNDQSLDGVAQIAGRIADASEQERAGRERPRVWLSVSRVPSVEETYLTEEWFKNHQEWFNGLVNQGLWRKDDHPEGLRSFEIPHRGRWGVGEPLLNDVWTVPPDDQLARAHALLTRTLFRWLIGVNAEALAGLLASLSVEDAAERVEAIQTIVAEAEARGDATALTAALMSLGGALHAVGNHKEALFAFERAAAAAVGSDSRVEYARAKVSQASALMSLERHEEALAIAKTGQSVAHEIGNRNIETLALGIMGAIHVVRADYSIAESTLEQALDIARASGELFSEQGLLRLIEMNNENRENNATTQLLQRTRANELLSSLKQAQRTGDAKEERKQIEDLLELSAEGVKLQNVEVLRARLDELQSKRSASK